MAGQQVTDPAILAQLNAADAPAPAPSAARTPVSDPALLAQLNTPDAPSVAGDVAASAGSGLVKGAAGAVAAPVALPKAVADAAVTGGDYVARKVLGLGPVSDDLAARRAAAKDQAGFGVPDVGDVVGKALGMLNGAMYAPKTVPGGYAQSVAEMAPNLAFGPGGAVRKVLGDVVAPGVLAETAGQVTKGTAAEPYARAAGGLAGNVGSAAARAYETAVPRALAARSDGLDAVDFAGGQVRQDTGTRIGVPLSGPEALQQQNTAAGPLGDLQRVVESSSGGGSRMAEFYADRPAQMQQATGEALNSIGPASATPSMLGPQAQAAAQSSLDDVRQGINAATRPAYAAASAHELTGADFEPIARDPAFQTSLARLRADPVLGPTYEHMPDNSVGVIDAVTKDMRAQSTALGNSANPGFQPQAAAIYSTGAGEARDIARTPARGGTQAYDDALAMQAQARAQNLDPLQNGPLGQVAGTSDTRSAYGALLPQNPLTGGHGEIGTAVGAIAQRDPVVAAALVRQSLADQADTAMSSNISGPNQFGGAKFAKAAVGTPQKAANLDAAVGALPTGAAARSALGDLFDTLQATGKRRGPGSNTSGDTQVRSELGESPLTGKVFDAVKTLGASVPGSVLGGIKDASTRIYLNRHMGQLAELFSDPQSAARIGAMVAGHNEAPYPAAFARQALDLGQPSPLSLMYAPRADNDQRKTAQR